MTLVKFTHEVERSNENIDVFEIEAEIESSIENFGEDEDGEIYISHRSTNNGAVYRVVLDCYATPLDCDNDGDGYTENEGDCDDTDPDLHSGTIWYQDNDGDGYGNNSISFTQCTQPPGPTNYVLDNTDYDDTNGNIYPGSPPARVNIP